MTKREIKYSNLSNKHIRGYPEYVTYKGFKNPLSQNQWFALQKKYLQRDKNGVLMEAPGETIYRVANAIAEVEKEYGKDKEYIENLTKDFYKMMSEGDFSPAGRGWTNAGTGIKGLFNCYVLPVKDDLNEIFDSVRKAAIVHKNGGGTGYNFSKLRPRGTYVKQSQGIASGPVSFISQFDKETSVINSGNRRGANMGVLNINHPDIFDFIYAKHKKGEITNFNVSVGVYDEFMKSLENQGYYNLEFPKGTPFHYSRLESVVKNIEEIKLGGAELGEAPKPASLRFDNKNIEPGKTKVVDRFTEKPAGRIDEEGIVQLDANYVFNRIAELAWETADPGVLFLDNINKNNPLIKTVGPIEATNPCGEQALHPLDACDLGSLILTNHINGGNIDYKKLGETTKKATRFLDNIIDANKGPIPEIEKTTKTNRRIGLGVMGWADMLARAGVRYDSEEGLNLAEKLMSYISQKSKEASVELAKEKGLFSSFKESSYNNGKLEDKVRNLQRTSIAPTGTISMLYDVNGGIEPYYLIGYQKNIRGGDELEYLIPEFERQAKQRGLDLEKILPQIEENEGSVQGIKDIPKDMQESFRTSHDMSYKDHISMQAAFQKETDNAVSKTINMKEDSTIEDIKKAYKLAWKKGIKGTTVYREGTKPEQVLESKKRIVQIPKGTMENPVKLPEIMPAVRIRQKTPQGNMHTFHVIDPSDYELVETFGTIGNAGGKEAATMEGMGRTTSLWLRSGGNIEKIIEQYEKIGSGSEESTNFKDQKGLVKTPQQGFAKSLTKYLFVNKTNLRDFFTGKVDLYKFSKNISNEVKKAGKDWKEYLKENKINKK